MVVYSVTEGGRMVKERDFEAGIFFLNQKNQISNIVLCLMSTFGLFQGDPWCLPTQNWLKHATNDYLNSGISQRNGSL